MDKKLTDNEIIKALECCTNEGYPLGCKKCPCNDNDFNCNENLDADALDLINRQKAEIESLKDFATAKCEDCAGCTSWKCDCANTKAEAYKEFAERLKEKAYTYSDITGYQSTVVDVNEIDGVYEELVGEAL